MRIMDRPEYAAKAKPMAFPPDTSVAEAVAAMSEKDYGSVVVVDGQNKVVGMVTERDVMKRLVNKKMDPEKTALSDIMTAEVRVARQTDDLRDWLRIMSNERFRRLPVLDDEGRLVSIMTQGDFVSYTWPELLDRVAEQTKATVASNYQIFLIAGGILVYSIVLIFMLNGAN
ncbi:MULTISPECIES: CBS domain-containing protein [unclassified Roseitalea]|uniref:CBS domain-containing protein n=1 Tax=unclassified Roseitalea TaxID=2639107 RepID=UPI00273D50A2|nr:MULTISPECIES: CBS domain-containing protein [unclassified Roseitalea]